MSQQLGEQLGNHRCQLMEQKQVHHKSILQEQPQGNHRCLLQEQLLGTICLYCWRLGGAVALLHRGAVAAPPQCVVTDGEELGRGQVGSAWNRG